MWTDAQAVMEQICEREYRLGGKLGRPLPTPGSNAFAAVMRRVVHVQVLIFNEEFLVSSSAGRARSL